MSTLPDIARDLTDRNRTSPFAFTGNKFEFRAVGAKQSPSFPVTLLNSAVAASIAEVTAALEAKAGGKTPSHTDIMAVIKQYITKTKAIRFEGDGYSAEWRAEAKKVLYCCYSFVFTLLTLTVNDTNLRLARIAEYSQRVGSVPRLAGPGAPKDAVGRAGHFHR